MLPRGQKEMTAVVEGDHNIEKEVPVATGQVLVGMHVTNWAAAQYTVKVVASREIIAVMNRKMSMI